MTVAVKKAAIGVFSLALLLGAGSQAYATTVGFDFNTVKLTNSDGSQNGSIQNASTPATAYNSTYGSGTNANVQTYMNNLLTTTGGYGSVVVTGANATNFYTGDGHVTGAGAKPITLASSDGPYGTTDAARSSAPTGLLASGGSNMTAKNDTFLDTENSSDIKMVFSGLKIYSVTFDYEIFPDGTCTDYTPAGCGGTGTPKTGMPNLPDFKFQAGNGTTMVTYLTTVADQVGTDPANTSTVSTLSNTEKAPQLAPRTTVTYTFSEAVTTLDFVDWPATIGIDNLRMTYGNAPEPGTLILIGTGVAGFLARRRRTTL